jgi:hypothetical protein
MALSIVAIVFFDMIRYLVNCNHIFDKSVISIFKVKMKSNLKTEEAGSSETSVTIYQTTKNQIPEDNGFNNVLSSLPCLLL